MQFIKGFLIVATMLSGLMARANIDSMVEILRFTPDTNQAQAERIINEAGYKVLFHHSATNIYSVRPIDRKSFDRDRFKRASEVFYIEPDREIKLMASSTLSEPNDPRFSSQDGLITLEAPAAWDITTGSNDIVVAVSDTGIAHQHEDLKNQMWRNEKEVPDNGIDDDGNGYIDDIHGWDWVSDDGDPKDDHMHGSHVAGIIGADSNNEIGVAGVNWQVRLMALKFLDRKGSGKTSSGIQSILYAADNGAHIINTSWGSKDFSEAMSDAIAYAASKGVLLVAAAGNASEDSDKEKFYPQSYELPNVISVGASTPSYNKARFSNFGKTSVDLFAPGYMILSTGRLGYTSLSGTSMASPMVAGIAALILSKYPRLSVVQLRNAIFNSSMANKKFNKSATQGWASAARALQQFSEGAQVWPARYTLNIGQSVQLSTHGISGGIAWSSSDTDVASVDGSGIVTAHTDGQVQIMARGSATATNEFIEVIGGDSGGGCSRVEGASEKVSTAGLGGLAGVLLIPLLLISLLRRRDDHS